MVGQQLGSDPAGALLRKIGMDFLPQPEPPDPDPSGGGRARPRGAPHLRIVRTFADPGHASSPPSPAQLAAWVRAVAAGDRPSFARLFGHFAPRIKSHLLRAGAGEDAAEELVQETMVLLWRKAAQFDEAQAGVATWVFTIARNLRVDRFRRAGGAAALPACEAEIDLDTFAHDALPPDEQLHARRLASGLGEALRSLPPEQALVLRLCYYQDEPHSRIAELLGIPLGTVKSRVRLAVAHLRRLLDAPADPPKP